jgi:hypothetical protein
LKKRLVNGAFQLWPTCHRRPRSPSWLPPHPSWSSPRARGRRRSLPAAVQEQPAGDPVGCSSPGTRGGHRAGHGSGGARRASQEHRPTLCYWRTETANQRGGNEWEPIKILLQELDLWPKVTSKDLYTNLPRSRSHNGPTDPRNKLEQA